MLMTAMESMAIFEVQVGRIRDLGEVGSWTDGRKLGVLFRGIFWPRMIGRIVIVGRADSRVSILRSALRDEVRGVK